MRELLLIATLALSACSTAAVEASVETTVPAYEQVDPAGFVRFDTEAEAAERRELLIDAIWPDGLPTTAAEVVVDPDAAGYAIVHDGHRPKGKIITDLDPTVETLEALGYQTFFLTMPEPTDDHGLLFDEHGTAAMRLFLDPVIEVVNAVEGQGKPIFMTGLSGGGWTTHVTAAIDTRIDVSVPVAGSLPLYLRPFSPGSEGDAEQVWPAIFGETDTDGDGVLDAPTGVTSWLEMYALATTGGRRHVQVLNVDDPCCFSGRVYESYAPWLSANWRGFSVVEVQSDGHEVDAETLAVIGAEAGALLDDHANVMP